MNRDEDEIKALRDSITACRKRERELEEQLDTKLKSIDRKKYKDPQIADAINKLTEYLERSISRCHINDPNDERGKFVWQSFYDTFPCTHKIHLTMDYDGLRW